MSSAAGSARIAVAQKARRSAGSRRLCGPSKSGIPTAFILALQYSDRKRRAGDGNRPQRSRAVRSIDGNCIDPAPSDVEIVFCIENQAGWSLGDGSVDDRARRRAPGGKDADVPSRRIHVTVVRHVNVTGAIDGDVSRSHDRVLQRPKGGSVGREDMNLTGQE